MFAGRVWIFRCGCRVDLWAVWHACIRLWHYHWYPCTAFKYHWVHLTDCYWKLSPGFVIDNFGVQKSMILGHTLLVLGRFCLAFTRTKWFLQVFWCCHCCWKVAGQLTRTTFRTWMWWAVHTFCDITDWRVTRHSCDDDWHSTIHRLYQPYSGFWAILSGSTLSSISSC